jgi:hypothetical protein
MGERGEDQLPSFLTETYLGYSKHRAMTNYGDQQEQYSENSV